MALLDSPTYRKDLTEACAHSVGLPSLGGSRVLVTGAGGLVGSHLVDALLFAREGLGLDVHVIATGRSHVRLLARFGEREGLELRAVDVAGPIEVDAPADLIVHAASNSHPASITGDPLGTAAANVAGTARLLEWGASHGCRRLLLVSSAEVYGRVGDGEGAMQEGCQGYVDPMDPRSCYPLSKRMAENVCACASGAGGYPDAVVARLAHTYGPTSTPADSRASAEFAREAAAGRGLVLRSRGGRLRSYTYVSDAVSGLLTLLAAGAPGEAYNVACPGPGATIARFAEAVAAAAGVGVSWGEADEAIDRTPIDRLVLDPAKLLALGWEAAYPLERGVAHDLAIRREAVRVHDGRSISS